MLDVSLSRNNAIFEGCILSTAKARKLRSCRKVIPGATSEEEVIRDHGANAERATEHDVKVESTGTGDRFVDEKVASAKEASVVAGATLKDAETGATMEGAAEVIVVGDVAKKKSDFGRSGDKKRDSGKGKND